VIQGGRLIPRSPSELGAESAVGEDVARAAEPVPVMRLPFLDRLVYDKRVGLRNPADQSDGAAGAPLTEAETALANAPASPLGSLVCACLYHVRAAPACSPAEGADGAAPACACADRAAPTRADGAAPARARAEGDARACT